MNTRRIKRPERMVDRVLAYRPKSKRKKKAKRKRTAAKKNAKKTAPS